MVLVKDAEGVSEFSAVSEYLTVFTDLEPEWADENGDAVGINELTSCWELSGTAFLV